MNLRELAENDLGAVLEDGVYGFGWPITVTDPAGVSASLTGFSNDIGQTIDPSTGELVSGQLASVVLRLSSLTAAGLSEPRHVADSASKPWVVTFNDINGTSRTYKVNQSNADRALGVVACILEGYAA